MIDLDAMRFRRDNPNLVGSLTQAPADRRALLAYVDALRELLLEALRCPHKVGSPHSTWDTRARAALERNPSGERDMKIDVEAWARRELERDVAHHFDLWVAACNERDALRSRLAEVERERDALANTLETIAHDGREYHGEFWSAEFAKSALSALERTP